MRTFRPKALEGHNRRTAVGLIIFSVLAFWVLGALLLLTIWGWFTYPTMADVNTLVGQDATNKAATFQELRQNWLEMVKDLGLTLTVTPATALLSAVIGYLMRGEHDSETTIQPHSATE